MKAVLFEKPGTLTLTTRPLRRLGHGELLVKVDVCGICGTDVHIVEGSSRSSPPLVLGHEYAGVVTDGESKEMIGKRVAVDPNICCGACYYCSRGLVHLCSNLRALGVDIDGGMAEYSIVPERQLHRIPEEMPQEAGAFIEPVSCAIHGIDKSGIRAGDTVVVIGGGTVGLIMLQLARNAGASRTILAEPLAHKREISRQLGADVVLDPLADDLRSAVGDLTSVGADVVIECVGRPQTMQLALELSRRGGTVEFFGVCPIGQTIPLQPHSVYFKELTIVGSYVNPHTFSRSIALLSSGRIRTDLFQVHRFPLEGVHEALRYQREGLTIKSMLTPQG
jgi:2-desacetyl-2-hydroxyethyl bacteriochlorophyllide A dehydrogenase